jgi:hypothetical protein
MSALLHKLVFNLKRNNTTIDIKNNIFKYYVKLSLKQYIEL